jgi:hypothetical protein
MPSDVPTLASTPFEPAQKTSNPDAAAAREARPAAAFESAINRPAERVCGVAWKRITFGFMATAASTDSSACVDRSDREMATVCGKALRFRRRAGTSPSQAGDCSRGQLETAAGEATGLSIVDDVEV